MRTVIVALQTHPKLMGSILGILNNMINKEVRSWLLGLCWGSVWKECLNT